MGESVFLLFFFWFAPSPLTTEKGREAENGKGSRQESKKHRMRKQSKPIPKMIPKRQVPAHHSISFSYLLSILSVYHIFVS